MYFLNARSIIYDDGEKCKYFFIFLKYFFQYNLCLAGFGAAYVRPGFGSAVIEGSPDLVETSGKLIEPPPYAAVAETLSLNIPSHFFRKIHENPRESFLHYMMWKRKGDGDEKKKSSCCKNRKTE